MFLAIVEFFKNLIASIIVWFQNLFSDNEVSVSSQRTLGTSVTEEDIVDVETAIVDANNAALLANETVGNVTETVAKVNLAVSDKPLDPETQKLVDLLNAESADIQIMGSEVEAGLLGMDQAAYEANINTESAVVTETMDSAESKEEANRNNAESSSRDATVASQGAEVAKMEVTVTSNEVSAKTPAEQTDALKQKLAHTQVSNNQSKTSIQSKIQTNNKSMNRGTPEERAVRKAKLLAKLAEKRAARLDRRNSKKEEIRKRIEASKISDNPEGAALMQKIRPTGVPKFKNDMSIEERILAKKEEAEMVKRRPVNKNLRSHDREIKQNAIRNKYSSAESAKEKAHAKNECAKLKREAAKKETDKQKRYRLLREAVLCERQAGSELKRAALLEKKARNAQKEIDNNLERKPTKSVSEAVSTINAGADHVIANTEVMVEREKVANQLASEIVSRIQKVPSELSS